jgi:hypothetical protein
MWQRFHTEEPSDPPHEGKVTRALHGEVHRVKCLGVILWVFIMNRQTLNNESLLEKLIVPWLFKKSPPHLHNLNLQYFALRSPQLPYSENLLKSRRVLFNIL